MSKVLANQNFFELYKALGEDDYTKMTTCPACQRKFRFTSVLIDHMASHYASNVDNIVEMKLKIWNNGSKLKCNFPGCKKKCAYTLDYTKHRDNHLYEGLACSVCSAVMASPAEYSVHLKEEHPDHLFSTESHQDDLVPPASSVKKRISQDAEVKEVAGVQVEEVLAAPITPGYTDGHQVILASDWSKLLILSSHWSGAHPQVCPAHHAGLPCWGRGAVPAHVPGHWSRRATVSSAHRPVLRGRDGPDLLRHRQHAHPRDHGAGAGDQHRGPGD